MKKNNKLKVLLTGAAGFIGFHMSKKLCSNGIEVIGIDNLNDYYDVQLKKDRLKIVKKYSNFSFFKQDIINKESTEKIFQNNKIDVIIHLAAQAGVRYSLENPQAYIDTNISGFLNILEFCKKYSINNLIYASSSSVYGKNEKLPFVENDKTELPLSLYAVSKKTNELMAHTYSNLYGINTIGLRFFTVYGPWGRPDMALFKFTKSILNNNPIDVYNNGKHSRSFTFIDDVVNSIFLLVSQLENKSKSDHIIFNIGGEKTIKLMDYITFIEKYLDKKAIINYLPMQLGDVENTIADCTKLENYINYKPLIEINQGIPSFINWFIDYYNKK